jgi:SpoVK/Ycf46/Vps4 family AAA+-type ATPase
LFGPPGTGKTSIATSLAREVKWKFIEIGPGDFLVNGMDGIFAQGDIIFQRLLLLDEIVVLFDEIDELVKNRSDDEKDKLSRFLTTYMLPWLQRLRDKQTIIFIFATNHIEVFDPAIKRIGRFDLIISVGPPIHEQRMKVLRAVRKDIGFPDDFGERIAEQITIGEICSAVDTIGPSLLQKSKAEMNECFPVKKRLITEREWLEFLENTQNIAANSKVEDGR